MAKESEAKPPGAVHPKVGVAPITLNLGYKIKPKHSGVAAACSPSSSPPVCLCCEAGECLADVSIAQAFQRAITQLPDALPCDAEHAADLLECVLAPTIETEIEPQHLRIAPLQRIQRLLDLVGQEAIHRLIFRVR